MPLIKGKDGRVYKGGISRAYGAQVDRSNGDIEILENKFFSTRREKSPPKVNQSHTHSRKKFTKPASGYAKRRCTTALSRQHNIHKSMKKNINHSDSNHMDDSISKGPINIYSQLP